MQRGRASKITAICLSVLVLEACEIFGPPIQSEPDPIYGQVASWDLPLTIATVEYPRFSGGVSGGVWEITYDSPPRYDIHIEWEVFILDPRIKEDLYIEVLVGEDVIVDRIILLRDEEYWFIWPEDTQGLPTGVTITVRLYENLA